MAGADFHGAGPSMKAQARGVQAALFIVLGLLSVAFILPLFWMVSTSLKAAEETMKMPPDLLPTHWHWANYLEAVTKFRFDELRFPFRYAFVLYTWNTVVVCVLSTAGTVLSCAMVAYGFAFLRWPGRNLMFGLTLATMMVPFPVIMVPLYVVFRNLHMIGSLSPLWLPAWFGSAWNIFLIRQFFLGMPKDLLDAARIDGCTEWQIFARVVLPLARPVLIVVGLFNVIYNWNDFLAPLLYLTKQEHYTISVGLQYFQSQHGGTEWHLLMAASTIVILPVLVLFLFGQRALIRGITLTGFKM